MYLLKLTIMKSLMYLPVLLMMKLTEFNISAWTNNYEV